MYTQQETMRHLLNLMESTGDQPVTDDKLDLSRGELGAISTALSGVNEEQLDEVNFKNLAAGTAFMLAALAPGVSHALSSSEVKTGSALATCAAVLDVAHANLNLPPDTKRNVDALSNKMYELQSGAISKAKRQGDLQGVMAIQSSGAEGVKIAQGLVRSGNSAELTKLVVQCINFGNK